MKRLSLLAFTLLLGCGHRSQDGNNTPGTNPRGPVKDSEIPQLKTCYQGDAWTCAVEQAIVTYTNQRRAGLGPLTQSFEASFVAREFSKQQARDQQISHNGFPENRSLILHTHFPDRDFFFTAENVAWVSNGETDADAVARAFVEMWWNSSGHRKNMLGQHTYLGAGVARDGQQIYATQLFH